jgi:hypothetical protein
MYYSVMVSEDYLHNKKIFPALEMLELECLNKEFMWFISSPEVVIHPLESSLLLGQSPTSKDGLKVDPLPLDLVEIVEVFIKIGQPLLPDGSLVLEALVVGRILQGLQQALVVTNLDIKKFFFLLIHAIEFGEQLNTEYCI